MGKEGGIEIQDSVEWIYPIGSGGRTAPEQR
jgi:hypothetical protein